MGRIALLAVGALASLLTMGTDAPAQPPIAIAIHGGAGTITPEKMTPEKEQAYREALLDAVEAGHAILEKGGTSLDAVEAVAIRLEDSPLFNAGKGSVFTHKGSIEMDAAIMDGATLQAGAVAELHHVRNPVRLARAVLEHSPHVFMVGRGAEEFALEQEFELVPQEYFFTRERWEQLQRAIEQDLIGMEGKFGTVGAVALDRQGNLAAATSTGGLTNKRYGRIGDVPVIGAGTYANNATCAVSATGDGEYFIRGVVAYDVAALMEYAELSAAAAADKVINEKLEKLGGGGGVIVVDREGNIAMTFNTPGMYRASIDREGRRTVAIYGDD